MTTPPSCALIRLLKCALIRMSETRIIGGLSRTDKALALHSVPCRVRIEEGMRDAPVDSYFTSTLRCDSDNSEWQLLIGLVQAP